MEVSHRCQQLICCHSHLPPKPEPDLIGFLYISTHINYLTEPIDIYAEVRKGHPDSDPPLVFLLMSDVVEYHFATVD
jgi:hypothetical protein